MQKKGTSRKPLIIGIVAAVAILAVLLVLLLTQCTGGNTESTTTTNTVETTEPLVLTYNLYWNADRAEYEGKSEAGLSSRQPEADGYFHIRFILDGEEVILKTKDRKLVNEIDVRTLMDLVLDENGIIVDVIDILDMPVQRLGWMFFVQSTAKNLIKLNSADGMNGIEVLLELTENTAVYDMSGETGPLGTKAEAMNMDRVYALGNLEGEVTHVFIYERSNYMLSHEAECQHCKKTVTWYEWTKETEMPTAAGHYQLRSDVKLSKQPKQEEDAKVCIDLNGHRVDAADGVRCYAMFNAGTELAIMDTSEGQTGVMASHGAGGEGMVVWVRYGVFYLYGGTLDGSDTVSQGNGVTVATRGSTYFYMHGGTLIGGVAEPYKKEDGNWTAGLGGTLSIGGKFVMNDGEIRGGTAKAVITARNADGTPKSFSRGLGGNIMMGGGSEMVMNGGLITGGCSGSNGGNIYMDSRASLTINDGTIQLGRANGYGRSGGNIYVGTKAIVTMIGGKILNGTAYSVGGNIRCKGTLTMNGGYIAGGRVRDWLTGEKVENSPGANIRIQDGYMYMYGGRIKGGVNVVDTSNKDAIKVRLYMSGYCTIDGGDENTRNLTLGAGGHGVIFNVGKMHEKSSVGVHATTGHFTEPTKEENKDGVFFSDIEGAEVVYHDGKLALGMLGCVCGSETHFGECDGTVQLWRPWVSTTSLPNSTGYWYLLSDLDELPKQTNVTNAEPQQVYLNLNGHSATVPTGTGRVYRVSGSNQLVITDHVGTGGLYSKGMSGDIGSVIFQQDKTSRVQLYGGTLGMTADCVTDTKSGGVIRTSGTFDMFGGAVTGGKAVEGGNIQLYTGSTMNMYGGTVQGGTAGDGTAGSHSNIYVYNAAFNMYGGTVYGIRATNSIENGCTINISGSAKILTGKGGHAFRMTATGELTADQRPMIQVGELNEDAVITISGISGYVTTTTDEDNLKYFDSSINEEISYMDSRVYIGMQACVCGSKTDVHIGDCDGAKHHWTAWTKTDSLPAESGYWYLIQDLTPTTFKKQTGLTNATAQQVYLNLNGFSATSAVRAYRVSESNLLAITDHKGGGGLYGGGLTGDNGGTILQQNSTSVIKMYGGTLGMGANAVADTAQGGILRMSGSFYLYGGTVTNGKAVDGGNIHLHTGSQFYLAGGTVTGGIATGSGGNFNISGGTLYLQKGTVTGGAAANGGNIHSNGTVEMTGGAVEKGTATVDGGNLYINEDSVKCTITGGTVTDGTATGAGGNLRVHKAKVAITGITVSGGKAAMGNNLYQAGGASEVTLTDATIHNTVTGSENTYVRAGKLNIQGTTELKTVDGSRNINTSEEGSGIIDLKSGTVTGAKTEADGANIWLSSRATLNVTGGTITGGDAGTKAGGNVYSNGGPVNISGGTVSGGKAAQGGNIALNNTVESTITGGTVTGGQATLGGNVSVVKGTLSADGGTVTDGASATAGNNLYISGSASVVTLSGVELVNTVGENENLLFRDGSLTISGGKLTTVTGSRNILAEKAGTIRIKGGKVEGADAHIMMTGTSRLEISGGTVTGSIHSASTGYVSVSGGTVSGNVRIASGTLKVSGDAIIKNGDGCNISMENTAALELSGGSVAGGIELEKDVTVKVSGEPVVDPELTDNGAKPAFGIDLTGGNIINVSGMTGGYILVKANQGKFAENATAAMTAYFKSTDETLSVLYADGALSLGIPVVEPVPADCVCGTTTDEHVSYTVDGVSYGCDGTELTWADTSTLPTATGNYRLTGDVTVSAAASLSATVVLDLNGHTVTVEADRMYTLAAGAKLTVTNSHPDKGGIVVAAAAGKTLSTGAVAQVAAGAELSVYNTEISMADGSSVTGNGGLLEVSGTANIFGSTNLSGGKSTVAGGNVYVGKSGVLNMFDGTVTKGSSVSGGNIGAEQGTVNLYGGNVTAGTATNGGNLYTSKATLNARAATISGGSCTGHGNNIYTTGSASKVYLTGTTVKNTVSNNEDNITYRAGALEIKNATLTSVDDDYNIFCQDTGANKAILLNKATLTGGGIYLTADKTVAIGSKLAGPVSVKYAAAITEPVVFATGSGYTLTYEAKSWFAGDGCQVAFMEGKLYLVPEDAHVHCICGGTLKDGNTFADDSRHTCEDVIFQALEVEGDSNVLTWSVAADVNWYLAEDLALDGQGGSGGFDVKLCLNGHSLHNSSLLIDCSILVAVDLSL